MATPLTPRAADFPRWYQDVIAQAELADNGPVRGTMVMRPWGYGLWERLQAEMDQRIKAAGAENAYFPLFIPESYLKREAEHVEGFSPELAVVTHAGGKELEEPAVVRPTSETVINSYFAKWVQSYRDLPLLLNQWANVVRWELRPRLFLRTSEFIWQEGHTAHATQPEATAYSLKILREVYIETMQEVLAVPVIAGRKTLHEQFAGAIRTWTCEGMMGDGKALQMGTSHELGQNFARAFGTQFSNPEGNLDYVWQTSWGASTRLIGGLIMVHGDDHGLRLPPALAQVQAVVTLVRESPEVVAAGEQLARELADAGVRVKLDAKTEVSFGRRAVAWELKGVPVRIEVGPRDLKEGQVTLVRRDNLSKTPVAIAGTVDAVKAALDQAQGALFDQALELRRSRTTEISAIQEAGAATEHGFAIIDWALVGTEGEQQLAQEGITVRCLTGPEGDVAESAEESSLKAVLARAY